VPEAMFLQVDNGKVSSQFRGSLMNATDGSGIAGGGGG